MIINSQPALADRGEEQMRVVIDCSLPTDMPRGGDGRKRIDPVHACNVRPTYILRRRNLLSKRLNSAIEATAMQCVIPSLHN